MREPSELLPQGWTMKTFPIAVAALLKRGLEDSSEHATLAELEKYVAIKDRPVRAVEQVVQSVGQAKPKSRSDNEF